MRYSVCLFYLLFLLFGTRTVAAAEIPVSPGDDLQQLLNTSQTGDQLVLKAGRYRGNFIVSKSIVLSGQSGAVIDANGTKDALRITAPNVTVRGLEVVNWGDDLTAQNAGIYVQKGADNALVEHNTLQGDSFGIFFEKVDGGLIRSNQVKGNSALRSADRGNGIHLSLVKNIEVRDNEISETRDGLYIISSQNNRLLNNRMHDLRFGIHYMYSHSNEVIDNQSWNNRVGLALMSSRNLVIAGNLSRDNESYGILMNFITHSEIRDNRIQRIHAPGMGTVLGAEGKALFVYNSAFNTIRGNSFVDSDLGIHLTAGSEGNKVYENAFVNNRTQVKYVVNDTQEWSAKNGYLSRGNYWSDYLGWDMNGDGLGDTAYEPNDSMDRLLWKYPSSRLLINSPAVIVLRWVQQQFPVFKAPGVKDSYPLMANPAQGYIDSNTNISTADTSIDSSVANQAVEYKQNGEQSL
ncbi:nitrous oxide reductase family maturation protein NosD [Endozoicomonadaceae bacterium StTr2]